MFPTGEHGSSIATLSLLDPRDLPERWDGFASLPPPASASLAGVLEATSEQEKLHCLRGAVAATLPHSQIEVASHDTNIGRADAIDHDRYCHVVRVRGDTYRIYVSGIVQVYAGLIEDLTTEVSSIAADGRARLYTALDTILSAALWPATGRHEVLAWNGMGRGTRPVVGLRRWINGHQVFLVIIQGLIGECRRLVQALGDRHHEGTNETFDRLSDLLNGSAVALRFTGDFPPADYEDVVRPSMMPPLAPAGMSGLLSSDHAHLIKLMSALKCKLVTLDPACAEAYQRFRDALSGAYDAHLFVCERFTGRKPSLLTVLNAETAAVEVLNRFKRSRLAMLPDSVRCELNQGMPTAQ
jgi:hypothetical protein